MIKAQQLLTSIDKTELSDEELIHFVTLLASEKESLAAQQALGYLCKVKTVTTEQLSFLSHCDVIKQSLSLQRILNLTIREREYREVEIKFKQQEKSASIWKTILSFLLPWYR